VIEGRGYILRILLSPLTGIKVKEIYPFIKIHLSLIWWGIGTRVYLVKNVVLSITFYLEMVKRLLTLYSKV